MAEDEEQLSEVQQAKQDRSQYKRLVAYNDWKNLPDGKRSVQAVYEQYILRRRAGDKTAPTNNRETIYSWYREDEWEARLAAEEQKAQEVQFADTVASRRRQTQIMAGMWGEANEAILAILRQNGDLKAKMETAFRLLDRTGFPAMSRLAAAKQANDDTSPGHMTAPPAAPRADAPQEEWEVYGAEMLRWEQAQQS